MDKSSREKGNLHTVFQYQLSTLNVAYIDSPIYGMNSCQIP